MSNKFNLTTVDANFHSLLSKLVTSIVEALDKKISACAIKHAQSTVDVTVEKDNLKSLGIDLDHDEHYKELLDAVEQFNQELLLLKDKRQKLLVLLEQFEESYKAAKQLEKNQTESEQAQKQALEQNLAFITQAVIPEIVANCKDMIVELNKEIAGHTALLASIDKVIKTAIKIHELASTVAKQAKELKEHIASGTKELETKKNQYPQHEDYIDTVIKARDKIATSIDNIAQLASKTAAENSPNSDKLKALRSQKAAAEQNILIAQSKIDGLQVMQEQLTTQNAQELLQTIAPNNTLTDEDQQEYLQQLSQEISSVKNSATTKEIAKNDVGHYQLEVQLNQTVQSFGSLTAEMRDIQEAIDQYSKLFQQSLEENNLSKIKEYSEEIEKLSSKAMAIAQNLTRTNVSNSLFPTNNSNAKSLSDFVQPMPNGQQEITQQENTNLPTHNLGH